MAKNKGGRPPKAFMPDAEFAKVYRRPSLQRLVNGAARSLYQGKGNRLLWGIMNIDTPEDLAQEGWLFIAKADDGDQKDYYYLQRAKWGWMDLIKKAKVIKESGNYDPLLEAVPLESIKYRFEGKGEAVPYYSPPKKE